MYHIIPPSGGRGLMTEKRFEEHIEKYLVETQNFASLRYHSVHHSQYDKTLCLLGAEVIAFIKASQPKSYENWQVQFGEQADEKLLSRLSTEIQKEGLIYFILVITHS